MKLFLFSVICFLAASAYADLPQGIWKSDYVSGYGTIAIEFQSLTQGTVTRDRNRSSIDNFGEPTAVTKMAIQNVPAQLKLVERAPDKGELYELDSPAVRNPDHTRVTIAVLKNFSGAVTRVRALIYKDDGTLLHILTLAQ